MFVSVCLLLTRVDLDLGECCVAASRRDGAPALSEDLWRTAAAVDAETKAVADCAVRERLRPV